MKDKDGEQNGFMEKRGNGESNEGDLVRYEGRGNMNITLCGSGMWKGEKDRK